MDPRLSNNFEKDMSLNEYFDQKNLQDPLKIPNKKSSRCSRSISRSKSRITSNSRLTNVRKSTAMDQSELKVESHDQIRIQNQNVPTDAENMDQLATEPCELITDLNKDEIGSKLKQFTNPYTDIQNSNINSDANSQIWIVQNKYDGLEPNDSIEEPSEQLVKSPPDRQYGH